MDYAKFVLCFVVFRRVSVYFGVFRRISACFAVSRGVSPSFGDRYTDHLSITPFDRCNRHERNNFPVTA